MGGLVKGVLGGIIGGGSSGAAQAGAAQNSDDARTLNLTSQTQVKDKALATIRDLVTGSLASIK
jgi:hypothetical protein